MFCSLQLIEIKLGLGPTYKKKKKKKKGKNFLNGPKNTPLIARVTLLIENNSKELFQERMLGLIFSGFGT